MKKYVIMGLLLLAACKPAPVPVISDCPVIASYSKAQQMEMVAEIGMLPPKAVLHKALIEWASLRAQLKKCQA